MQNEIIEMTVIATRAANACRDHPPSLQFSHLSYSFHANYTSNIRRYRNIKNVRGRAVTVYSQNTARIADNIHWTFTFSRLF